MIDSGKHRNVLLYDPIQVFHCSSYEGLSTLLHDLRHTDVAITNDERRELTGFIKFVGNFPNPLEALITENNGMKQDCGVLPLSGRHRTLDAFAPLSSPCDLFSINHQVEITIAKRTINAGAVRMYAHSFKPMEKGLADQRVTFTDADFLSFPGHHH
nr:MULTISPECIES: hypothetical protein [unclassified Marinobacter]